MKLMAVRMINEKLAMLKYERQQFDNYQKDIKGHYSFIQEEHGRQSSGLQTKHRKLFRVARCLGNVIYEAVRAT